MISLDAEFISPLYKHIHRYILYLKVTTSIQKVLGIWDRAYVDCVKLHIKLKGLFNVQTNLVGEE